LNVSEVNTGMLMGRLKALWQHDEYCMRVHYNR